MEDDLSKLLRQIKATTAPPKLLSDCFQSQFDFITDPARFKVALCARRAAKSFALAIAILLELYRYPGSTGVFMQPTLKNAQRQLQEILGQLDEAYSLGLRFVGSHEGECWLPNQSRIFMAGSDATKDELDKMRGYRPVIYALDEMQDMKNGQVLFNSVIFPSLMDSHGKCLAAGTASEKIKTYFQRITSDPNDTDGWSLHSWLATENTTRNPFTGERVCDQVQKSINELKERNPNIETEPFFQREFMAKWVLDDASKVYRPLSTQKNKADKNIDFTDGSWTLLLGIDPGAVDAFAFVVCAWKLSDPNFYIVEAHAIKDIGFEFIGAGEFIRELDAKYHFQKMFIDARDKLGAATIKKHLQLPLLPADKGNKPNTIKLFNGDISKGLLKVCEQPWNAISDEITELIWDPDYIGLKEKAGCENDQMDATLYTYKEARHYLFKKPDDKPKMTREEMLNTEWRRSVDEMLEQEDAKEEGDWLVQLQQAYKHWNL